MPERGKKPDYVQQREDAARLKNERETDHRYIASIDRIANALESTKDQEQGDDDKRAFREVLTIALLIFTVIFTGAADVIFKWTLDDAHSNAENQLTKMTEASSLTRDSNQINRDAVSTSNRAWVGPSDATIIGVVKENTPMVVNISLFNTGREPAKSFSRDVDIITATGESTMLTMDMRDYVAKCFAKPQTYQAQVIYPTVGFGGGGVSYQYTLDAEKVTNAIVSGAAFVIVRGCLTYETTGHTKHSAFCFYYKGGSTKPDLNICESGADAE